MTFEAITIHLRDGRACLLRPPKVEDAEQMFAYLHRIARETPYIINTEEDISGMGMTVESEALFLNRMLTAPDTLMIVAEVEGRVAGNCQIRFMMKRKVRHRADIGIALLQDYWGQGIGTAMFRMMEQVARNRGGIRQMELEYVEGNTRARGLYEKMGFRIVSMHPNAVRQADGSYAHSYLMVKEL